MEKTMFAERLNALMNIAETSNTKLAREINMNSSHIGRLRNGVRPLPHKHDFIEPMCNYLVRQIKKDYQVEALSRITGMADIDIAQRKKLVQFLAAWLTEKGNQELIATRALIADFAGHISNSDNDDDIVTDPPDCGSYYYGNAGKRQAVERFFEMILEEDVPQTLLLYSDEEMLWLYEDKKFTQRWYSLFVEVLQRGNKVKIIHTVRRSMGDLMEAAQKWLPIYMSGSIEPYYYPKLRDTVFQQTIFLAPRTAAVLSTSVRFNTAGMLNIFLVDKAALRAIGEGYNRFHALCKPLMQIYKYDQLAEVLKNVSSVIAAPGELLISHQLPFLNGMPQEVFEQLMADVKDSAMRGIWQDARDVFAAILDNRTVTRLLTPPELIEHSGEPIIMPMSETVLKEKKEMTKAQYRACVDSLLEFANQNDHYNVVYAKAVPKDVLMLVKEDVGVVWIKTSHPFVAFIFNEENMINVYCDYLKNLNDNW